jgi:hypothetical protein
MYNRRDGDDASWENEKFSKDVRIGELIRQGGIAVFILSNTVKRLAHTP